MKIIISCAGNKSEQATKLRDFSGREIIFVADPCKVKNGNEGIIYFRPDDRNPSSNKSWREFLVEYNNQGDNYLNLTKAANLYKPNIYKALVNKFGWDNVFILSAGWGLVRANYLLPYYNITFSYSKYPETIRKEKQIFHDFDHLKDDDVEDHEIHYFGGDKYLNLLYQLTNQIHADKFIHYSKQNIDALSGYKYIKYSRSFTNWYYECAKEFIEKRQS